MLLNEATYGISSPNHAREPSWGMFIMGTASFHKKWMAWYTVSSEVLMGGTQGPEICCGDSCRLVG
jgi:hypothetical protein